MCVCVFPSFNKHLCFISSIAAAVVGGDDDGVDGCLLPFLEKGKHMARQSTRSNSYVRIFLFNK